MTNGEMMVWAAAFVKHADLSNPPSHVLKPDNDEAWAEWERCKISSAVEHAETMVNYLRESLPRIAEGWGKTDDTYLFAKQMCKRK